MDDAGEDKQPMGEIDNIDIKVTEDKDKKEEEKDEKLLDELKL